MHIGWRERGEGGGVWRGGMLCVEGREVVCGGEGGREGGGVWRGGR